MNACRFPKRLLIVLLAVGLIATHRRRHHAGDWQHHADEWRNHMENMRNWRKTQVA